MATKHRHAHFLASFLAGCVAFAAAFVSIPGMALTVGANTFFFLYVVLVLRSMPKRTADFFSRHAVESDEPPWLIFVVTIAVVGVAVESLFVVINASQLPNPFWLAFSILSLPLGWLTVHSMAALHYADLYWQGGKARGGEGNSPAGMSFPGTARPVGWDFLYFSLVIGMTAQTADVDITETRVRIFAMLHCLLSFSFNTIIIAAAVNLVVSLTS